MTEHVLLNLCSSGSKNLPSTQSKNVCPPGQSQLPTKSCWIQGIVFYKLLFPSKKTIVAFYRKKSERQKQSGIQLGKIFDSSSPVCPGQGSPFPSLLSAPDISFSPSRSGDPFVPNHSPPAATAASFPPSSLGTFPPPLRPSELMYGASPQDCSL